MNKAPSLICEKCTQKLINLGYYHFHFLTNICEKTVNEVIVLYRDSKYDYITTLVIPELEEHNFLISIDVHDNLLFIKINPYSGKYDNVKNCFCWCY